MVPAAAQVVKKDYQAVRKELESIMDVDGYDDGSYGPLLVRLAWHAAGTYDKSSKTGGSNGATMRFSPECQHGANAGLAKAREILEPIKKKFPWISYADLWTLGGVVAIETMGGGWTPLGTAFSSSLFLSSLSLSLSRCIIRCPMQAPSSPGGPGASTSSTEPTARPTAACPTPRWELRMCATSSTAWASTTRRWSP